MSSSAEAEIGTTFLNAKYVLPIRTALKELGHPQLPNPMQVYNTTAVGFENNKIKHKWSKVIDICFYWIRNCTCQGRFNIYWVPGSTNPRYYHTKYHSSGHHWLVRPHFLHYKPHVHLSKIFVMHLLWGCVNSWRMRAVCANPDINARRHITAVNPFWPVFVASHDHKLINNVFLSYYCHKTV